eukprot:GDKI01044683.1.p1 GENE.GDKI01044683.1~~GDKI01044683.1.p1  ORF type:complete len:479 (-),score=156.99 GDKI01044683.1:317-1753(-)
MTAKSSQGAESKGATTSKRPEMEFGGVLGATALILWSHCNLFYFWYCYERHDGKLLLPTSKEQLVHELSGFYDLLMTSGIPTTTVWLCYTAFFVVQIALAAVVPGKTMYGVPINDQGKRLVYHCNGYLCYYICLAGLFALHFTGVMPLTYCADNFGRFFIASMIIADVTSVWWYVLGLFTDPPSSRTGNAIYDFFMGTVLYPRIGEVDIKMIAEVRWSWLTLMILTLSAAAKQYELAGYVTGEMCFMLLAHWLYSNACVKGEHYIPATWDMFHEKFGWMLNFWNVCGVPFLYCFQSYYILKNYKQIVLDRPCVYHLPGIFVLLLVAYYIFDTANSQKASLKLPNITRSTFPQLPWRSLGSSARCIRTPKGDLLVDGWYMFARKLQYTGDILMALTWGLVCGFRSPLPYFYCVFFIGMINHRQSRDELRCGAKYGKDWELYKQNVPNVFIPDMVALAKYAFTGKRPELKGVEVVEKKLK